MFEDKIKTIKQDDTEQTKIINNRKVQDIHKFRKKEIEDILHKDRSLKISSWSLGTGND